MLPVTTLQHKSKIAPNYCKAPKLLKNKLLFPTTQLKISKKFPNIYIVEDLTQLRYKLLNYVKTKYDDEFVMCHTYNRKTRMKKCGKKETGLLCRHQMTYSN